METEEMRNKLFAELGINWGDRSQKAFDIAYEEGHSEGESGVRNWLITLRPLLTESNCCDDCYVEYCSTPDCECHSRRTT